MGKPTPLDQGVSTISVVVAAAACGLESMGVIETGSGRVVTGHLQSGVAGAFHPCPLQQGVEQGNQETLLYNERNELTEASSCNAFIVKNDRVITPLLDHQKLPGITREILIDILRNDGNIPVEERVVTMNEVAEADEVWITSSSREIAPVIAIDSVPVGDGQVGDVWLAAQTLFSANRFNY